MPQLMELMEIYNSPSASAVFHVDSVNEADAGNILHILALPTLLPPVKGFWLAPRPEKVGDAPQLYHHKFIMAVLSVADFAGNLRSLTDRVLSAAKIPEIHFNTDEWTRRSMTLNGMRMTTEYSTSGSKRVLQLIEARLATRQSDVVHDVLVYLMNQILDARSTELNERLLRAEAVVAFLNLDRAVTDQLFLNQQLYPEEITSAIRSGKAGPLHRAVDLEPLIANQLQILEPVVRQRKLIEAHLLGLVNEIAGKI